MAFLMSPRAHQAAVVEVLASAWVEFVTINDSILVTVEAIPTAARHGIVSVFRIMGEDHAMHGSHLVVSVSKDSAHGGLFLSLGNETVGWISGDEVEALEVTQDHSIQLNLGPIGQTPAFTVAVTQRVEAQVEVFTGAVRNDGLTLFRVLAEEGFRFVTKLLFHGSVD
jgi:hypothetical protein